MAPSRFSGLTQLTSVFYSFAPDGGLRESFAVDSGPSIDPRVTWAGGRVALSGSRISDGGSTSQRYLRYLSCP